MVYYLFSAVFFYLLGPDYMRRAGPVSFGSGSHLLLLLNIYILKAALLCRDDFQAGIT